MLKRLLDVVKRLRKILDMEHMNWMISGALAIKLHGVNVKVKTIDILTDDEGAYTIGKALESTHRVIVPVDFRKIGNIIAHFGVFDIENIPINVIGNPIISFQGILIKFDVKDLLSIANSLRVNDEVFLTPPLEWQLIYQKLSSSDNDLLYAIINFLKKNGYNEELFERLLQTLPKVVREELKKLLL